MTPAQPQPSSSSQTFWWLSAIMLLGSLLRLSIYNLEPLFMDSAYYASLSRSIADGDYWLQVNSMSDKPPLFFYVQAFFFRWLGVSEAVALIPSFLGGILGIGFLYLLGDKLKNPSVGLIAALLFAVSPGSVVLSTIGFIDSLFMAIVLFSFWTLLHRNYYWTGLWIGIGFGFKQTIFALGPLYLVWMLVLEFHSNSWKEGLRHSVKSSLQIIPGFLLLFLPILYWGIFITSERMRLFQYVTGFISGSKSRDVGIAHDNKHLLCVGGGQCPPYESDYTRKLLFHYLTYEKQTIRQN